MSQFYVELEKELLFQTKLLKESQQTRAALPEGYLYIRQSPKGPLYYQITKTFQNGRWHTTQKNISHDPALILSLTEKRISSQTIKLCHNNLKLLKKTLAQYQPYDKENLLNALPEKFQQPLLLRKQTQLDAWTKAPYEKCPQDVRYHIHETACGELVRSKSEVIIANALWSCQVPFHYEEKLPCPDENGNFYYPDFTIWLPDGKRLIWEHLGLLGEMGYCVENAYKLNSYQHNDFVIGKNLILTQDDSRGTCSSAVIYHIIETYILPKLQGLRLKN